MLPSEVPHPQLTLLLMLLRPPRGLLATPQTEPHRPHVTLLMLANALLETLLPTQRRLPVTLHALAGGPPAMLLTLPQTQLSAQLTKLVVCCTTSRRESSALVRLRPRLLKT
jgi:hypothetical protein